MCPRSCSSDAVIRVAGAPASSASAALCSACSSCVTGSSVYMRLPWALKSARIASSVRTIRSLRAREGARFSLRSNRTRLVGREGLRRRVDHPCLRQNAGGFENGIGHRAEQRVHALEVGDEIEMQRTGLDRLWCVAGEALKVAVGVLHLQFAERDLLR